MTMLSPRMSENENIILIETRLAAARHHQSEVDPDVFQIKAVKFTKFQKLKCTELLHVICNQRQVY